jgi:hypothetical protein
MILDSIRLEKIFPLLEEEVRALQNLLEDVQQEWECLVKNDIASLSALLQEKEKDMLKTLQAVQSVDQAFGEMVRDWAGPPVPKTVFDLASSLPPAQAQKMDAYKNTVARLRQSIWRWTEQNKRFLKESLCFINDLITLLTRPGKEETVYRRGGRKENVPLPSSWVSRKV